MKNSHFTLRASIKSETTIDLCMKKWGSDNIDWPHTRESGGSVDPLTPCFRGLWLMVKLFSKNSNLCDHNSPTLQTDGRTDGRTDGQTTCDRNTALCTKVHRAVKIDMSDLTVTSHHNIKATGNSRLPDSREFPGIRHLKNSLREFPGISKNQFYLIDLWKVAVMKTNFPSFLEFKI